MVSAATLKPPIYSCQCVRRAGSLKKSVACLSTVSGAPWAISSEKRIGNVEKLVGHPSPLLSLQQFIGSELTHLPSQIQRLLSSQHPIVKRARLFFERSETHSSHSSHGLLTLLVSKAVNILNPMLPDIDQFGILPNQRTLAEITEMIQLANLIQSEVINLSNVSEEETSSAKDLKFGNKLIILGGDLLLARACKELALLYNPQIIALISQAISDMMTGAYQQLPHCPIHFESKQDNCDSSFVNSRNSYVDTSSPDPYNEITSGPFTTPDPQSLYSSYFHYATLLSNSCQSCAVMAELNEDTQTAVAIFGRQLSIAKQAVSDRERWKYSGKSGNETTVHVKIVQLCSQIAKEACLKSLNTLEFLPDSKPRSLLEEMVLNISSIA